MLKEFWSLNEIYSIHLYLEKVLVCHFKYVVVFVLRKFVETTLMNLNLKKNPTTDHTFINFGEIVRPPCLFRTTLLFGPLEYMHLVKILPTVQAT